MRSDTVRLSLAAAGIALWAAYPFVLQHGGAAVWHYQCSRAPWIDGEDPCFTDYLPVMEEAAVVVMLLLAYPFARFAFTLFAPPPPERGRRWRLAGASAAWHRYPGLQILAALGLPWAVLHARPYPLALYPYLTYWAAWIAWFCLGIWMSRPRRKAVPVA